LHGSWLGVAVLYKIALQVSGEREFREIFHLDFAEENRRADYRSGERGLRINFQ
jgi:hypothetical protein